LDDLKKMTNFVMTYDVIMMNTLKMHIKSNGIKLSDIAMHTGIDQSLISRIVSGQRIPTNEQLERIASYTGLDFHQLLKESLGRKVYELLRLYPEVALDAMMVAEERIAYLRSDKKFIPIEIDSSLRDKLTKIDLLHNQWQKRRPISGITLKKMEEYFHTSYTYESNRIEGNTLTLQETHLVINEGITIGGKSISEHFEAINHKEAIEMIYALAKDAIPLSNYRLKQIHQLILKGIDNQNAGRYRQVAVRISGSEHVPPEPFELEMLMEDYFEFYNQNRHQLHPVLLAAEMHERLVTIHPFVDGNGRTSRLVMNLILLQNGYTIANLKGSLEHRLRYYKALEAVQLNHDKTDFYDLIADHVLQSLEEHLALA
jgi:fido (protein-threonine AMPylation protein)/transcriptional regulator with XRE-family HTH domain